MSEYMMSDEVADLYGYNLEHEDCGYPDDYDPDYGDEDAGHCRVCDEDVRITERFTVNRADPTEAVRYSCGHTAVPFYES